MSKGVNIACDYKALFRVCGLSEKVLGKVVSDHMKGVAHRTGANYKNKSEKILIVDLNKTITVGFLKDILETAVGYTHYEFIVSTANDNESFIIELPEYIC